MECTFDAGVETGLRCTRCGRAACPQCLVDAPVGQQCPACIEGLAPDVALDAADLRRLRRASRGAVPATGAGRRPGWVFYALTAAFVGVVALPVLTRPAVDSTVARVEALAIVLVGAVLATTLHEFGHAVVAFRGGDRSVAAKGYLSLDFRRYAHPLLSIGLPLLFLLLGGLPLPGGAVWIDRAALRGRWWDTAVSVAGPAMNALTGAALLVLVGTGLLDRSPVAASALSFLAWILFVVAILNLLPVPGLDGYGALRPHLPPAVQHAVAPLEQFGLLLILVLVFSTGALGFMYDWALRASLALGADPGMLLLGFELANPRITG